MIKKILVKVASAAAIMCGICMSASSVSAATVEDVAETARKYGIPESFVQQGFNEYYADPDAYTSDDFDSAIAYIEVYHQEILDKLCPTGTTTGSGTNTSEQTTTQTTTQAGQQGTVTGGNSGTTGGSDAGYKTDDDGFISESEFIKMTLEQKQQYVASLSEEQRQIFMNSLSPEELKSIVKQLPTEDKVSVIDKFVDAGDAMGVKVTVDEITDDSVSMIMHNKDGELIDVAAVGVIVEDTGYDYKLIYSVAGVMLFAAAGGLWIVIRKITSDKKAGADNE